MDDAVEAGVAVEEIWYANTDMSVLMIDETGNTEMGHKAYATSTFDGMNGVSEGTFISNKVVVENLTENETCEYQWFYSVDGGESWIEIEEADSETYGYVFNFNTWQASWRAVVTIH